VLFADDVHAQFDAFIAYEYRRTGYEFAHLVLALSAERAVEGILGVATAGLAGHEPPIKALILEGIRLAAQASVVQQHFTPNGLPEITISGANTRLGVPLE